MTVPPYPRPVAGLALKRGLQHLSRRERERFFVLVVRMVARGRQP